ncbi:MAG: methionyl-tRNA formyltransferase [Verrucomicrobia bacterium]|nr:methionyl-tRNA formyltransferase [Verrucomicrobiota bacterium]
MRIVFMGTGEISLPCLRALLDSSHEMVGVVTQPDRPVGRHQELHPPAPKVAAEAAGIFVLQPERLRSEEDRAELVALKPEVIVVMAYGQILPKAVLDLPSLACINVHASLLPRHRGASCIQAAIAEGNLTSGVTVMHVSKGLDTGDVILRKEVPLALDETGGSLHDRLADLSPPVLMEALAQLEAGTAGREMQDEAEASYAPKLLREDGRIDWELPAVELERRIRAFDPWPGTFALYKDVRGRERRLKIFPGGRVRAGEGRPGGIQTGEEGEFLVACGTGLLTLAEAQPEGGRRMGVGEFMAGHFPSGEGQLF